MSESDDNGFVFHGLHVRLSHNQRATAFGALARHITAGHHARSVFVSKLDCGIEVISEIDMSIMLTQ
eukprot:SAG11_NODE_1306_length_5245_cov_6.023513_13_plen_67_part_00